MDYIFDNYLSDGGCEILRTMLESPKCASAEIFMAPRQFDFSGSPSPQDLFFMDLPGKFISLSVALQHPFSRGHVHIESKDPTREPRIDPKCLSHPIDLEIYARYMIWLETIARTEPLASFLEPGGWRNAPNALMKDVPTAKQYVKETAMSNWHPVGTCAMMPRESGGVVDGRLIVHGTRNLRVVDASVFPLIPTGNIQSSVCAIAERAADLIKEDHGLM